jgi:hypothetical protein
MVIVSGDKRELQVLKKRVLKWQKDLAIESIRCGNDGSPLSPVIDSDRLYLECKRCGYKLYDIPDEMLQKDALGTFRETWSIKNWKTQWFIIIILFELLKLTADLITHSRRH